MVGCAVALFCKTTRVQKMQGKIIKSHAGPALTMASTILCAGVFLGVMQQTEIMTHMANVLANVVPTSHGEDFLPLIVGRYLLPAYTDV